jgi:hypothetical protein
MFNGVVAYVAECTKVFESAGPVTHTQVMRTTLPSENQQDQSINGSV